jgi:DNA mismatch repair ATPase MutS
MEALLSLAGYAYERPQDPFPEFTSEGPVFEGAGLRHPLLGDRAVPNDVTLGGEARLLIVSGSNMSGKSTLLRTVGVNAVLGLAGGPVRAARLRIQPVAVGASIRISDSLQGGISRFYAEITRIRKLVDLAATGPLIFLLDELLHGTNSHDRRIGADAILRALIARGATGMATTHDLALADIASTPGVHARNVHFEDHLEEGQMRFDYVLRDGVVTKSNALELMRSVGLEV